MSFLLASSAPIPGAFTLRSYAGFGILGADIPTTGDSGGSPALNDGIVADAEYYWRVETLPASGTLEIFPDLSFEHTGMADGSWPWDYSLYETGALKGTWTVTDTSGTVSHLITVANSQQINTASPASIQQTHLITVADSQQVNSASPGTVAQTHLIVAANSQQVNTASPGVVTQSTTHYITIADSQQVNTASDAAIAQTHLITIGNSQQTNRASSGSIAVGIVGSIPPGPPAYRIATQKRTYKVRKMSILPAKDPAERKIVTFDFTGDALTIASATITATVSEGKKDTSAQTIVDGASAPDGPLVRQFIVGGQLGSTYDLRCVATDVDGEIHVAVGRLPVQRATP